MIELPLEYWNKLASQFIFISALLGGFSLAVTSSLLNAESSDRVKTNMFRAAVVSAASFLITIFAMTRILMMTTPGFPLKVTTSDLSLPRLVGILMFLTGIFSIITLVSLAGWAKSKKMGRFTTIVGILTLMLILMMLVDGGKG